MKNLAKIVFTLTLLAVSSATMAVDDEYRFHRCYALFTAERVPLDHPLLKKVVAGTLSGTDACMELINEAAINDNGTIAAGVEPQKILARLNELHTQWFYIKDPAGLNTLFGYSWANIDLHDKWDPAMHMSYSILKPGMQFKDIVTRKFNLEAIRNSPNQPYAPPADLSRNPCADGFFPGAWKTETNQFGFIGRPTEGQGWSMNLYQGVGLVSYYHPLYQAWCESPWGIKPWNPKFIARGQIVGIKPLSYSNPVVNINNVPYPDSPVFAAGQPTYNNFNQFFKAGVLGTQAYMIGNVNHGGGMDGAINVRRRWGKNILSDFLCRELPTLRSTDVLSEVHADSNISFRKGISCMTCHMSMDPIAGASRRIMGQSNNSYGSYYGNVATYMNDFGQEGTTSAPYPTIDGDGQFSNRVPEGRIMFRGYDGILHDDNVIGLEALGEKFAEYDDLYVCGAKKYYKILTGIDVRMPDPGDINSIKLNAAEKSHQDLVVKWGLELKKTQDVKKLIKNIIASPNFIRVEPN